MGLFNKSDYQKKCEYRIKKLCGGMTPSDEFMRKARPYKYELNPTNIYEKKVLKLECINQTLKYEDIEERLDELLHLDCETLYNQLYKKYNEDTSIYKTQEDIEKSMGDEYSQEYYAKLAKKKAKYNVKMQKVESIREKGRQKELDVYSKYNIFNGTLAEVILPEKEIVTRYVDNRFSRAVAVKYFGTIGLAIKDEIVEEEVNRSIKTILKVVDKGIVFKNAQKDGKDLRIPYEAIISVEPIKNDDLKITLLENQMILVRFDISEIWDYTKNKNLINNQFMSVVNSKAKGKELEDEGWEVYSDDTDLIPSESHLLENEYSQINEDISKAPEKIYCSQCGHENDYDSNFCVNCGLTLEK